jgi:acyl-CoA synthetase (NDP forming)
MKKGKIMGGEVRFSRKYIDLDLLFRPRSIAVVGVSRDFTKGGGFIWWRINRQGFKGEKYPISRGNREIDGVVCYPSILDIDAHIDLCIVAIPSHGVERVIEECVKKGVKFVVIHAAGFAELGEEGRKLQERIVHIARNGGMRIVGPNCMGIFCPEVKLNTIVELDDSDTEPGDVSFCGQSGWTTEDFIAEGSSRGLRFNTVISSGNQADLDLVDYLNFFASDPKTKIICAYSEGIKRGKDFLDIALQIGISKPLIIWKSGFSQGGRRAALSHSGSIAGNREIWVGVARRAGIILAEGIEDLVDKAVAFSGPLIPKGRRIGIMAEAGGGGISAADACERHGLEVRPFSSELQERLKGFLKDHLPPFSGTTNPLDVVWLPQDKALEITGRCIEMISEEVDSLIYMSYLPFFLAEYRPRYIEIMSQLSKRLQLPIYIVPPYASRAHEGMKEFTIAGLPAFSSFERAAGAVSSLVLYREWRERNNF